MEKKRKKISEKIEAKPAQPRHVEAKPAPKAQPVLNEKDKAILDDVEHIIWNPDLLKNLKKGKSQPPDGYAKKKALLK
jgi:hypothetical protein